MQLWGRDLFYQNTLQTVKHDFFAQWPAIKSLINDIIYPNIAHHRLFWNIIFTAPLTRKNDGGNDASHKANKNSISVQTELDTRNARIYVWFPEIVCHHLSRMPSVVCQLGLTSATFLTTDSALTALTTAYSVDLIGTHKEENPNEPIM